MVDSWSSRLSVPKILLLDGSIGSAERRHTTLTVRFAGIAKAWLRVSWGQVDSSPVMEPLALRPRLRMIEIMS